MDFEKKLKEEAEKAKEEYRKNGSKMKGAMVAPIHNIVERFCFQEKEFADAVERSDMTIGQIIEKIAGKLSAKHPAISDVEAYKIAVKCYLPAAVVTASFRVTLPDEYDADLFDDLSGDAAKILNLDLSELGEV